MPDQTAVTADLESEQLQLLVHAVCLTLTLEALKFVCLNIGDSKCFSIRKYHKCLSQLSPLYLNTYVMGLLPS